MPKNYSFPRQWYERSDFLSQRTKFGAEKVMGLTSKIQVTSNLHSRIWSLLLGSVEQGEKKDLQAFIHAKCARGTWKSPHTSCLGWGRNYGKSRMQNTCQRWRRNWHQSSVPSAFTELFSQVGFLLNIRNQDWFKGSWILRNPYQHSFEFWMPKCVECIHKDPLDSNNSCNCWYLMEEIRNSSFRAHSTSWIKFQKLQPWNLPKCNPPKSWRVLVSKDFPFQRGEKISGEPARYICQTRGFWYQTSLGKPCRCHSIFNSGSTCRVLSSQSWLNFGQKKTSRWKILGFHRCLASFGNNGAPFLASRFLFDQNRRVICKNDRYTLEVYHETWKWAQEKIPFRKHQVQVPCQSFVYGAFHQPGTFPRISSPTWRRRKQHCSEGVRCSVQIARRARLKDIPKCCPNIAVALKHTKFIQFCWFWLSKSQIVPAKGETNIEFLVRFRYLSSFFNAIIGKIVALVLSWPDWPVSSSPSDGLSYRWDLLFECFQRNRWQLVCLDKVFCALIWRRPKRGVLSYLILPGYFK